MFVRVLIFITLLALAQSAKILGFFPFPSQSHHIVGSALLKELARRGHEVTMISPFPFKSPPENYTDVHLRGLMEMKENVNVTIAMVDPKASLPAKINSRVNDVKIFSRILLEHPDLQSFLNSAPKFDVIIQLNAMTEALLGIGHKLNASTICFSMVGTSPMISYFTSNPSPYSYVPNLYLPYTDKMSFTERFVNTFASIYFDYLLHFYNMPYQQELLTEFFPDAPKLTELMENVDLILLNSHYSTETARPYLPNLIQIGGFHLEERETLPDDIKKFLDASKHGVIYFSLGSNVKSSVLPKNTIQAIMNVFSKIKYDILWKYEDDNLEGKPSNVLISKWLPQRAVLDHPKVKVFVTHGGHGSTVEAVYYGVPMICLPFFGDQHKNCADSVLNGYAVELNIFKLTESEFGASIKEITENPSYAKRVEFQSDLYRNQEINPMEKAVYWIEHIIKHKNGKHLKSRATLMPWYQYMLLDIIGCILGVVTVVIVVVSWVVICIFKYLFRARKSIAKNNKKLKKH